MPRKHSLAKNLVAITLFVKSALLSTRSPAFGRRTVQTPLIVAFLPAVDLQNVVRLEATMPAIPLGPLIVGVTLLFAAGFKYIIHPVFLSPLSRVPTAHASASISSLWILWVRHQFAENGMLLAAHSRLGPVVRLGPNEISVNCVDDGLRTIYPGGFEKSRWYSNLFENYNGYNFVFERSEL